MIRTSSRWNPGSGTWQRALPALAMLVLGGFAAPGTAAAQERAEGRPLENSVTLSIGWFRPADDVFRGVYGSQQVPIGVDASYRLWRAVSVFGGVRYVRANGQAQPLRSGAAGAEEESGVRLSTLTGRAGALVAVRHAGWEFEAGGGATMGRYAESWAVEAGPQTRGQVSATRIGALVQAAASRSLSRRLAVVGRVEWSLVPRAPARQGIANVPRDLGGFETAIGLRVRF